MQILEYSEWGVRSARINLTSPGSAISVTLFPMVHVGEAEFYREVYDDAFVHDVALVEGVRSPITKRVTRSYRWFIGSKRLPGLILQPRSPEAGTVPARIIHADLSGEAFALVWAKVPLWLRGLFYVGAPLMGLWMRAFATRETIGKRLTMDDQPSQAELLSWNPEVAGLEAAILDARDAFLIERLEEVLDTPNRSARRVAVVYGARHVRAVLHALTGRRGFIAHHARWLTVFGL